jgi:uncharacterized alkaline shock family protein YloU
MSNPTTKTDTQSEEKSRGEGGRDVSRRTGSTALESEFGRTQIADLVVQKIAGMATREVSGVAELGGGTSRAIGALRERIPGAGTSHGQGVTVEVGEKQAAVDLEIMTDYGVAIPDVARSIRRNVMTAIERMTGLEVVEVNINVNDVFLGGEQGGRTGTGSSSSSGGGGSEEGSARSSGRVE